MSGASWLGAERRLGLVSSANLGSRLRGMDQLGQEGGSFPVGYERGSLATLLGFCFLPPVPGRGGWRSWLQALSLEFAISIRTQDEQNT